MCKLVAVGELLIDFTPKGFSESGNPIFERNAGGAPANVAVQAARLGTSTAFIGKVGQDSFGAFLKETLQKNGVNSCGVVSDGQAHTTLAFVELDNTGNRSFTFYRNHTADVQLKAEDIDYSLIDNCRLFHFGSISLTDSPSRETVLKLAAYAKEKGKIISYDPNWRPLLWKSEEAGIEGMRLPLKYCDILKVSEEELPLLSGCADLESGVKEMLSIGIAIVIVTAGAKGCYIASRYTDGPIKHIPAHKVKAVDTTGSGDSFLGAFLHKIIRATAPLSSLDMDKLEQLARYANAAGSGCATAFGAIPAMPDEDKIKAVMKEELCLILGD